MNLPGKLKSRMRSRARAAGFWPTYALTRLFLLIVQVTRGRADVFSVENRIEEPEVMKLRWNLRTR